MQSPNSFPFQIKTEVIFRDVDAMGHVNHAVFFTYMETARTQFFFQKLALDSLAELPLILAEAQCSYKAPAHFGQKLTIGLGIGRIGRKSFDIEYRITAEDGQIIAQAKTIMVVYDYEKQSSIPIPDNLKMLLQSFFIPG